ncbi:hypothetical protein EZS27_010141 [termite gut metagenome]|uniref:Uncharacterized protein n=1 Tax=termite gut metagenome TaxID=433724 RepID=A0A5J4S7M7_9ZZZZ
MSYDLNYFFISTNLLIYGYKIGAFAKWLLYEADRAVEMQKRRINGKKGCVKSMTSPPYLFSQRFPIRF